MASALPAAVDDAFRFMATPRIAAAPDLEKVLVNMVT